MLQMDLIDAAGDTPGAEDDEEDRAAQRLVPGRPEAEHRQEPAPRSQSQGPGGGDTYRPKRPTTLNLFPQVPRSQVRCEQVGAGFGGRCPRPGPGRCKECQAPQGPGRAAGWEREGLRGRDVPVLRWEVSGLMRLQKAS